MKEVRTCCRDGWRWQQFGFRQLYRGQTAWFETARDIFNLSVHITQKFYVLQVGSLTTCEMCSLENYPVSSPGRYPWSTCGKGASRHSFDFDMLLIFPVWVAKWWWRSALWISIRCPFQVVSLDVSTENAWERLTNIESNKWFLRRLIVSSRIQFQISWCFFSFLKKRKIRTYVWRYKIDVRPLRFQVRHP